MEGGIEAQAVFLNTLALCSGMAGEYANREEVLSSLAQFLNMPVGAATKEAKHATKAGFVVLDDYTVSGLTARGRMFIDQVATECTPAYEVAAAFGITGRPLFSASVTPGRVWSLEHRARDWSITVAAGGGEVLGIRLHPKHKAHGYLHWGKPSFSPEQGEDQKKVAGIEVPEICCWRFADYLPYIETMAKGLHYLARDPGVSGITGDDVAMFQSSIEDARRNWKGR